MKGKSVALKWPTVNFRTQILFEEKITYTGFCGEVKWIRHARITKKVGAKICIFRNLGGVNYKQK